MNAGWKIPFLVPHVVFIFRLNLIYKDMLLTNTDSASKMRTNLAENTLSSFVTMFLLAVICHTFEPELVTIGV